MESRNLIVRETCFDDCDLFTKWENLPDVADHFTLDEDRTYENLVTEYVRYNLDPTKLQFTIVLKEDSQPIGRIYISGINNKCDSLDLSQVYIADKKHRNHGYGEEAIRLILEYAFINLHMERVTTTIFENNKIAMLLYEKLGFKPEGTLRNGGKKNGKYLDLRLMSMLRSDYYESMRD